MACTISGKVVTYTATGSLSGQDQKYVYLIPSRSGFEFTNDGGTTWALWEGDPDLDETYPGAIAAQTNNNGDWSIEVPYTDTEVQLPGGAPLPDLYWNIVDPNSPTTRVYTGQTASGVVGAAKTTQELIALPAPDTWTLGPDTYYAVPAGVRRQASVSWTSSSTQTAALTFVTMGTSAWRCTMGLESDDGDPDQHYTVIVDTGTKTNVGADVYISRLPPSGKTVIAHFEVF